MNAGENIVTGNVTNVLVEEGSVLSMEKAVVKQRVPSEGPAAATDDRDDALSSSSTESESHRKIPPEQVLGSELQWYQNLEAANVFSKLENILRKMCKRLNLTNKVDSSIKLGAANPSAEKYTLVQRTGTEIFKCTVTLLGELLLQTEVTMKYPKMPGGVYRATAQPDVQWKLQQLQDADNYCAQALSTTVKGLKWVKRLKSCDDDFARVSTTLVTIISEITNLIGQARSTLCMPRKRTLLELCNLPITRCFNPPLPPDLVFSYYISTNRLVCAAYQVSPKPSASGSQNLTVTLADCFLPHLVDILFMIDQALVVAQQFSKNLGMMREQIHSFNVSKRDI